MALIESKTYKKCGTCQYWDGERKAHRSFEKTVETPSFTTKGMCTCAKQFQLKGKQVEAQYTNSCGCYQPWDQMKQ